MTKPYTMEDRMRGVLNPNLDPVQDKSVSRAVRIKRITEKGGAQ